MLVKSLYFLLINYFSTNSLLTKMNKKFAVFQELKNSEITNTYTVHCAFYSLSISRKIEFEIVRQNTLFV